MNIFPKQEEVIDAVVAGLNKAKRNYSFWTSDELYLSNATENFLTIHVAQEIAKIEDTPEIFIDATVSDILRCSLPDRSAFKEFMKNKSIQDRYLSITLDTRFKHRTDNDSISKVIMSVRNGVRNAQEDYKNDIHLICKMLERSNKEDSTLDYGLFAFYLDISNSARKDAKKRLEEIIKSFDEIVNSYENLKSSFKGGDIKKLEKIGEWCIGCYIIEHTL
ncbi:MAG: hypothetical protein C0626_10740 [Arcobacter sp.]|uniref:hypothetical protein n=1 Tax=uncultured Arcobacter sp. TaxID=165434 RepID=UPI000CC4DF32|nr:hypothetical protein [uncultured Arcobacter sp.]PLY09448.1 MAG: hypothetical protein C0626_10740 [Arcobacter sp.]